jgi:hypothetical protein
MRWSLTKGSDALEEDMFGMTWGDTHLTRSRKGCGAVWDGLLFSEAFRGAIVTQQVC